MRVRITVEDCPLGDIQITQEAFFGADANPEKVTVKLLDLALAQVYGAYGLDLKSSAGE